VTKGRVLLAGETWISYGIHQKGFGAYTTGDYHEGSDEFIAAMRSTGWSVEHIPNHLATERFPRCVEDLQAFDVVILSDIGADTLLLHPDTFVAGKRTPNRFKAIGEWVHGGGGFLMVGGYMSFSGYEGKAGYNRTAVDRYLPVTMLGFDDRIETPEGVTPAVALADHPITAGLPQEWPYFLGYNRVRPRTGGQVILSFEDDPLLVVDAYGKGRVAAFTSDCSPHWGSPAFMSWSGYGPFWDHLLSWLTQQ